MSLAIKKKFPKFYIWQKKIRNRMPCKIEFWDKQYYNVNYKIKQLFKVWINNKSEIKIIAKRTNLLGQDINENTTGIIIEIYEDGTISKTIK